MNENTNALHAIKDHALLEEIDASSKMIVLGLAEIQKISHSNQFYFLPLQLLANGIERLLKCMICLGFYNKFGNYPTEQFLKSNLGHKLEKSLKFLLDEYYQDNTPRLREYRIFLESNTDLLKAIMILSDFAQMGRYGNLRVVTGDMAPFTDSINKWESFEGEPLFEDEDLLKMLSKIGQEEYVYAKLQNRIVKVFEKFIHILSMQFTIGNLGDLGRKYYGPLHHFSDIKDSNLGRFDYRYFSNWYNQSIRIKHKINWFGHIKRRVNPNIKWKTIKRIDYQGEWPYYTDKVIIECHSKIWCLVCINGKSYALNGAAKSRYNITDVYQAGMATPGIFPHEFIKMAQSW